MKLWEVIKELTEDPKKKFEATLDCTSNTVRMRVETGVSRYFKFEVFNGSKLIEQSYNGGAFNGNVALGLDWHEVKQPVPWQEAIQAWADGKKVRYKYPDDKTMYPFEDTNKMLSIEKIKTADWYVED